MARSWFVVRRAKFHGNIKILLLGKFEFIFHFENSDQILKIAIYLHCMRFLNWLFIVAVRLWKRNGIHGSLPVSPAPAKAHRFAPSKLKSAIASNRNYFPQTAV